MQLVPALPVPCSRYGFEHQLGAPTPPCTAASASPSEPAEAAARIGVALDVARRDAHLVVAPRPGQRGDRGRPVGAEVGVGLTADHHSVIHIQ